MGDAGGAFLSKLGAWGISNTYLATITIIGSRRSFQGTRSCDCAQPSCTLWGGKGRLWRAWPKGTQVLLAVLGRTCWHLVAVLNKLVSTGQGAQIYEAGAISADPSSGRTVHFPLAVATEKTPQGCPGDRDRLHSRRGSGMGVQSVLCPGLQLRGSWSPRAPAADATGAHGSATTVPLGHTSTKVPSI